MTTDTVPMAPTDAEIEALAHRMCWRYTPAANQFRGSTYTFNRTTLLNFARAALARRGQPDGEHTNAELCQMLDECYEEKKKCYFALSQHQKAIDNLIAERDALKAAHSGEPVAWLDPWTGAKVTTDYDAYGKHGIPLYTAPQPVAREPLSEAQREEVIEAVDWYNFPRDVIDAVERAHGIKGGQHGADT